MAVRSRRGSVARVQVDLLQRMRQALAAARAAAGQLGRIFRGPRRSGRGPSQQKAATVACGCIDEVVSPQNTVGYLLDELLWETVQEEEDSWGVFWGDEVMPLAVASAVEANGAAVTDAAVAIGTALAQQDCGVIGAASGAALVDEVLASCAEATKPKIFAAVEAPIIPRQGSGSVSEASTVSPRSSTDESVFKSLRALRCVHFNHDADTLHEIPAYAEIYGIHPRLFDFDRKLWMVPARGLRLPTPGMMQENENEDTESSSSDEEGDVWYVDAVTPSS